MKQMKKKVFGIVAIMMTFIIASALPAGADVYIGGGSGSGSASTNQGGGWNGSGLTWQYVGPDINHMTVANRWRNDGGPTNGRYWNSVYVLPGKSNAGYSPGVAGVRQAIINVEPACARPDVAGVFLLLYATQWNWNKWMYSRDASSGAGNWHVPIRYEGLWDKFGLAYGRGTTIEKTAYLKNELKGNRAIASSTANPKTVVCVTGFDDGTPVTEYSPRYAEITEETANTCVYSRSVGVERTISERIGRGDSLHDQDAVSQNTIFGHAMDELEAMNPQPTPAEAKAFLDPKCAATANEARPSIDLDEDNQKGLAEGGVLNIEEFEKYGTYISTRDFEKMRACVKITYMRHSDGRISGRQKVNVSRQECINRGHPKKKRYTPTSGDANVEKIPSLTGFWQILSVHCNIDDFNKLLAEVPGATVVSKDDSGGQFSAVVHSPAYEEVPARFDFGDIRNPAGTAKHKSATAAFYDKECPFTCTADGGTPPSDESGSPAENVRGAAPDEGSTGDGYGAVSDDFNGNKFRFFRDNEPNTIKVDVWYPVNDGAVNYNGEAAISTTINRSPDGTPSIDGSDGGQFTMKTADGQKLFQGEGSSIVQKNWETAPSSSSSTSETLSGLHREFTVQSTWASEKGKPQAFDVKWEYAPQVSTSFPTTLGLTTSGGVVADNNVAQSTAIEGKCYAAFGTDNSIDTKVPFYNYTGTGTPNDLDGSLYTGGGPASFIVEFVRSTAE